MSPPAALLVAAVLTDQELIRKNDGVLLTHILCSTFLGYECQLARYSAHSYK